MKHKLICLILCLLLLPSLFLSVGAEQQYVIDNADLMSSSEEAALEEKAQALRQEYGMDVVILTVDSLDGKRPQDYANDYYDYNGYSEDGVIFILSMEKRDRYISTCGNAAYVLTDYWHPAGRRKRPSVPEKRRLLWRFRRIPGRAAHLFFRLQ